MKISTLKYFVEIATENSFTKASQKLYVSQPTLSRRIQELDLELGVNLFNRSSSNQIKLSTEGEQLLTKVNDILKQIEFISNMFNIQADDKINESTVIKIGYLSNFNFGKLYEIIENFKLLYPKVKFLVTNDTPMGLNEGLKQGKYNLVVNLENYTDLSDNMAKHIFMKNHLQIALPVNHKFSEKKILNFSDLSNETLILIDREQSPLVFDYVISQCVKHGFNAKANSYVKNLEEGLSKASIGEGIAFLYSGMNNGTLENKYHIRTIDLENNANPQDIIFAYNRKEKDIEVKKFVEFLFESDNV